MCLIITGPAASIRSTLLNVPGLLQDIYDSNKDGVGAMYATSKHGLRVIKSLPKNYNECRAFIGRMPSDARNLAIHFRMRTHGAIDLENCHPYSVKQGLAMMHNGMLQHGNAPDESKSDTWHYINDYLAPLELEHPGISFDPVFQAMVENDIGSNRFVFLDAAGNMAIYHREDGIEHDGMWFSNTYAWSPELLIPGYRKAHVWDYGGAWHGGDNHWMDEYDIPVGSASAADDSEELAVEEINDELWEDDIWTAVSTSDAVMLGEMLDEAPALTIGMLFKECEYSVFPTYTPIDTRLGSSEVRLINMLVDEDRSGLLTWVRSGKRSAEQLAECICFYGEWVGKPINQKVPDQQSGLHQGALALVQW